MHWQNSNNDGFRKLGIFKSNATTAQIALTQTEPTSDTVINYVQTVQGFASLTASDTVVFQAAVSATATAAQNILGVTPGPPNTTDLVSTVEIYRIA